MSNVFLISAYVLSLSVVGGGRCLFIKGVFIALLMTRLPFLPGPFWYESYCNPSVLCVLKIITEAS